MTPELEEEDWIRGSTEAEEGMKPNLEEEH